MAQNPDCVYLEICEKNFVIFIAIIKFFSPPNVAFCADRRMISVRMHDWK